MLISGNTVLISCFEYEKSPRNAGLGVIFQLQLEEQISYLEY